MSWQQNKHFRDSINNYIELCLYLKITKRYNLNNQVLK